jgi:hypothetical protein
MTLTYWNGTILGPYGVILKFIYRQLFKIVFTVFQLPVDLNILKKLHKYNSILKLICLVSIKEMEELKI